MLAHSHVISLGIVVISDIVAPVTHAGTLSHAGCGHIQSDTQSHIEGRGRAPHKGLAAKKVTVTARHKRGRGTCREAESLAH